MVHGFESVIAALDMQDKKKETAFAQAFMQDLDKYVTNVRQSRQSVMQALEEIDLNDLDGYTVHQKDETTFILVHEDTSKKEYQIKMRRSADGHISFDGLPNQMVGLLGRFSKEEL